MRKQMRRVPALCAVFGMGALGFGTSNLQADDQMGAVADREVESYLGVPESTRDFDLPSAMYPALALIRDDQSETYRTRIPLSHEGVTVALAVEAGEKVSVQRRRSAQNKRLKFRQGSAHRDGKRFEVISFNGLAVGANTIELAIALHGQSTADARKLSLVVTRMETPGSDSSLDSIGISHGKLDPAFASGTFAYEASVAYAVDELALSVERVQSGTTIAVTGTSTEGNALDVDGDLRVSGFAVGRNDIQIRASSEDGSETRMYVLQVLRQEPASDSTLNGLSLAVGQRSSFAFFGMDIPDRSILQPPFSEALRRYEVTVPSGEPQGGHVAVRAVGDSIQGLSAVGLAADGTELGEQGLTGNMNDESFLIKYFGGLQQGVNTIEVRVTAEDGVTESVYRIDVRRD